ncbi:hypothetical protein KSC_093700 [Ktedonobacter sp. SOSP1-52]|nr:hypothetical protein KSC_093700 [Ktedonobacter sp. SOSP1-52]
MGKSLDPDDVMKMPCESVLDDMSALWKADRHQERLVQERLPTRTRLEVRSLEGLQMREEKEKREQTDRSDPCDETRAIEAVAGFHHEIPFEYVPV